jgi:peptide chain release factor 3
MANTRKSSEEAFAGDIIGIHNHGQLQIGDTLTEGERLTFRGIPYFAPELFVSARPADPMKAKQLQKGLSELGEEGAVQVFTNELGRRLLGAVGRLQFDIVAHRLKGEYGVDAIYEPADIYTARWLRFPDAASRQKFAQRESVALAEDVDGNPVYLAASRYKLQITQERFPEVGFHATREHGEVMRQG